MSDPSADWTDEQILEYARGILTDRLDQAQRALDRGCSMEEVFDDQDLPMTIVRVAEGDVRELGVADYVLRRGRRMRQWVYRDRRQPEKFFILSLGTRSVLRQRGFAMVLALVHDEEKKESN